MGARFLHKDDKTTKWCASVAGAASWLTIDLGRSCRIIRMTVMHAVAYGDDPNVNRADFEVSVGAQPPGQGGPPPGKPGRRRGRYVTLKVNADAHGPARIYEFKAWGKPEGKRRRKKRKRRG